MKIKKRNERLCERKYTIFDLFWMPNVISNKPPYYDYRKIKFFQLMSDGTQLGLAGVYKWLSDKYPSKRMFDIKAAYDTEFSRICGNKIASETTLNIIKDAMMFYLDNTRVSNHSEKTFENFINPDLSGSQSDMQFRKYVLEIACSGHSYAQGLENSYFLNSFMNLYLNNYGNELNHLYEAMVAEYDPIENYSMTENETVNNDGTRDTTTSQDTTGKTEFGKVVDNDRAITETNTITGITSTKNTGTDVTDIKTDNTQTSDGNTKKTGTTTETRALTNTNNTTDSNTETNDLTEKIDSTNDGTRTDNLTETTASHNDNTRTDALKEVTATTDDNNKTINTTETRTDELKEVESVNGNDTKTTDLLDKTIYNSTTNESNNIDKSGSNKSTRTDNLTQTTNGSDTTEYGKTVNVGINGSDTKSMSKGDSTTDTKTMKKHYTTTTEELFKNKNGEQYKEIVGEPSTQDGVEGTPFSDKKIYSGGYEDTSTYNHERLEPQTRETKVEETTTGKYETTTTDTTGRSAYNMSGDNNFINRDKEVTGFKQESFPTKTTTTTPAEGSEAYKITDKTADNTKDSTKRMYTLTDSAGNINDYKETTQQLGTRLKMEGGKQTIEEYKDEKDSVESNTITLDSRGNETGSHDETQNTKEGGTDILTKADSVVNTGTQVTEDIISETEDTHLVNNKSGDDTVKRTGTETNVNTNNRTTDNTGTQTNKTVGTEDDLHTVDSTRDNTGTVKTVDDGTGSVTNTGTVTNNNVEDTTRKNTGTVKNDRTVSVNGSEGGTVTVENNLSDTTVETVTDDGTQKNTRTLDLTEAGTTSTEENGNTTDKLKITQSGEDNVTENVKGTTKELSSEDITRVLTRRGNIGVTTSQQMIESSINLYTQFSFAEIVAKLASNLLTIDVY